ncbi:hypothetical protein CHU93_13610 [Sandarakinorhabdus cyanobacteriorum]|uniref:Sulfotransferase domain-containing protein n=1 Tax=Sandarakinorhabdus cyanobacteriorum TaxID=1981098 RepID=A0A255Y9C5_9SPHN|nr:sulfotransferase [Sandarakinorhabdus cyanobacteriorum]OYQ25753.1 hypothetical protein CHU93_13610 [Sandarakinorhabdus cyanobacteriorum]
MTTPPLLIHVGYHKTATTWMQRRLFTPPLGYHPIMEHETVFAHFVRPHMFEYDAAAARAAVAKALAEVPVGLTPVISSEILCGNPTYGSREALGIARRLHDAAPGARILVTIREQVAAIASTYMQYLQRGGEFSAQAFFAEAPEVGWPVFNHAHFRYDRFVAMYADLFGPDQVLVCNQELLMRDHVGFAQRIADFAGQPGPVNQAALNPERTGVSYPEYGAGLLRFINNVRPGPAGPSAMPNLGSAGDLLYRAAGKLLRLDLVRSGFGNRKPVTDYVRKRYAGAFVDSNRALAAMVQPGLPFERYQGLG